MDTFLVVSKTTEVNKTTSIFTRIRCEDGTEKFTLNETVPKPTDTIDKRAIQEVVSVESYVICTECGKKHVLEGNGERQSPPPRITFPMETRAEKKAMGKVVPPWLDDSVIQTVKNLSVYSKPQGWVCEDCGATHLSQYNPVIGCPVCVHKKEKDEIKQCVDSYIAYIDNVYRGRAPYTQIQIGRILSKYKISPKKRHIVAQCLKEIGYECSYGDRVFKKVM